MAFPKSLYEYGLFTKSINREVPPITILTMLILGRHSESKCSNTSLHLKSTDTPKAYYIFKEETANSTVFPQAGLSGKDVVNN